MLPDCKQTAELVTENQIRPETVIVFLQHLTNFIKTLHYLKSFTCQTVGFSLIKCALVHKNLGYFYFCKTPEKNDQSPL